MSRTFLWALGGLALLCWSQAGRAAVSDGAAATEIKVASVHFPPYVYADEPERGLLAQLLGALNRQQQDYRFIARDTSLARRFSDLRDGQVDLAVFENPDWGWQGIAAARLEMGLEDAEIYVAQAQPGRDQSFFQPLQGKRLALFKGYHYGFSGFANDPQLLREQYSAELTYSHDSILGLVLRGRADIGLLTRSWLKERQIREPAPQAQLLIGDQVDQTYRHYMLLRPQAAITPARLEALLEALHHSGELQRIFEPYGVQVKAHVTDR